MARGAIAKQVVINKLAKAFGEDWIGEVDKKFYVWADDGGQPVQICISMTCPKVEVMTAADGTKKVEERMNFEDMAPAAVEYKPAEITQEEKDTVADLMARLGL